MADVVQTESATPRVESQPTPQQFRVVRKEYVMEQYPGEEGGMSDYDERLVGSAIVKAGRNANTAGLDAHGLKMDEKDYPIYPYWSEYRELEERAGEDVSDYPVYPPGDYAPTIGESTYSYELQTSMDGKWTRAGTVTPYREEKPQE